MQQSQVISLPAAMALRSASLRSCSLAMLGSHIMVVAPVDNGRGAAGFRPPAPFSASYRLAKISVAWVSLVTSLISATPSENFLTVSASSLAMSTE